MRLSALFSIIRPVNALVSGLTAILAYLIATGTIIPGTVLLFLIVLCITGAGNTINDYYDAAIDRINRPSRPIPSGTITERGALFWSLTLFTLGVILSLFTNVFCAAIAVVNSLVLILYAARLKGIALAGNLAVAYLTGSIFLFGAVYAGIPAIIPVLPIALITFFGTLGRELLKDAEDITGDAAGGAKTLAVSLGIQKTGILALVSLIIAVGSSLVPAGYWGAGYLLLILPVDCLILAAGLLAVRCTTPGDLVCSRATSLLKAGMFAALAVFAVSAVLF